MVYFQTKNPNLGKFWSVLQHFVAIWSILLPFRILNGHMVYFVVILVYFSRFGICTKKNMAALDLKVVFGKCLP
jgi:hypothetical protein